MPAIYHEGSWLGNATDPEVLVKDTVGWTGKNRAFSQTNNAVIAHIENGITYDVSWTGSATVTLKKNSTSGATITSGSTSPLSFTADADYELYFGSSANVTEIMVKDSRITDSTYEPYHESVEVMYEEEIHGVNLLENTAVTTTAGNVTFTVNSNGSITINSNGAISGNQFLVFGYFTLPKGSYILSHGHSIESEVHFSLYISTPDLVVIASQRDDQNEARFTITTDTVCQGVIRAYDGKTINNMTVYPMLRKADIEDSTYHPYNPQAIQNQLNAQGVLGAKNWLPNIVTNQTKNGITWTKNSDGTLTANGTATAASEVAVVSPNTYDTAGLFQSGQKYIYSIGIPLNMLSTYGIEAYGDFRNDTDTGWEDGLPIDTPFNGKPNKVGFYIRVKNGVTVNNLVFKPMVRLASDPDDTYQPYAMTNRELTENKLDNVFRSNTYGAYNGDLNDLTDGIRYCNGASANVPVTNAWGFCQTYYGGSANRIQLYFTNVGKIYSRVFDSSTWKPWKEITMV